MAQGSAWDREKILASLEYYFKLGYKRAKACRFVGINQSNLTRWEEDEPELAIKIDGWINEINTSSRKVLRDEIEVNKNWQVAREWLEKMDKEDFGKSMQLEQTIKDDTKTQEALDKLNNFLNGQQTQSNSADVPGNVQNPAIRGTGSDNTGNT